MFVMVENAESQDTDLPPEGLKNLRPFVSTKLQEDREGDGSRVIPVRLNKEEVEQLQADARYLEQEKISTALKQLALIGHFAIHDQKMKAVLDVVFINRRKNQRLGINIADPDFKRL